MNAIKDAPGLICSTCGLTTAELRDTGRMGCPQCYAVFAAMVARAAAELHRSAPDPPATVPPVTQGRASLPWPTRRAEVQRAGPGPLPQNGKTTKRRR